MATVNFEKEVRVRDRTFRATWGTFGDADTGTAWTGLPPYDGGGHGLVVAVSGTFAGATVTIQGSIDGGTTWFTIHDQDGNDMTFTAARIESVAESVLQIRPVTSGGAGTAVTVVAIVTASENC